MSKLKEEFIDSINEVKKHLKDSESAIFILGSNEKVDIEAISTGIKSLDNAIGIGGIPRGRITEVYGPESSGKSTLCLRMIAACQKAGGTAFFIDAEHALDTLWAEKLGVDIDLLAVQQPDHAEAALDTVLLLLKHTKCDLIIIDSVPSLVPKAELEGDMESQTVALQARIMSKALRKIVGPLGKTRTALVFVNQIREKIGSFVKFGTPETQPGGRALKFYSSVRLDIRKIDIIKNGSGSIKGIISKVKVKKNKVAPPFKEAEFHIDFAKGSNVAKDLFDIALDEGIIEKKGAWYYIDDFKTHGEVEMIKALEENDNVRMSLESKLNNNE